MFSELQYLQVLPVMPSSNVIQLAILFDIDWINQHRCLINLALGCRDLSGSFSVREDQSSVEKVQSWNSQKVSRLDTSYDFWLVGLNL